MSVHSSLGPGLLESAYRVCFCHELSLRGIAHERELQLPITYKGLTVEGGYRVDVLVEKAVVVELKAVAAVAPVHEAQLLSYLRMSHHRVGLLINFHEKHLRHGLKRMVNGFRG